MSLTQQGIDALERAAGMASNQRRASTNVMYITGTILPHNKSHTIPLLIDQRDVPTLTSACRKLAEAEQITEIPIRNRIATMHLARRFAATGTDGRPTSTHAITQCHVRVKVCLRVQHYSLSNDSEIWRLIIECYSVCEI